MLWTLTSADVAAIAQLETLAHRMADANDVETAWALLGVLDALSGEPCPKGVFDGDYGTEYRDGRMLVEG